MFRDVPGCSGMFRDVPECSGMFHVLDFIDGPIDQSQGIPGACNRNEALTTMMLKRSTFSSPPSPHAVFAQNFLKPLSLSLEQATFALVNQQ